MTRAPRPTIAPTRDRAMRRGFSLLEIMIAIMILGIGMVMVATVFPVGLEITGESVQMNVSQQVFEYAMSVVAVRVPPVKDFGSPAVSQRVVVPDVQKLDLNLKQGSLATLNNQDVFVLNAAVPPRSLGTLTPGPTPWITAWTTLDLSLNAGQWNTVLTKSRVFTEFPGWDAEITGNPNWATVVPLPNIPGGYVAAAVADPAAVADFPVPRPPLMRVNARANFPRIHLLDRVWPPLPIEYFEDPANPNQTGYYLVPDNDPSAFEFLGDPANNTFRGPRVAQLIATGDDLLGIRPRRFAWGMLHHRISSATNIRHLLISVACLHRADPNARFVRQADESGSSNFTYNPSDPPDREALILPRTQYEAPSATPPEPYVFPEPWLVMLNRVNFSSGELICSSNVARLLPAGSFFIIAERKGNFFPGTAHEVSTVDDPGVFPDSDPDNPTARLTVTGGSGSANDLLVWVYPPAYTPPSGTAPGTFAPNSPVVGVGLRQVKIP